MLLIVLVLLLVMALGLVPTTGFHSYGWGPSSVISVVLVVLLLFFLFGRF